MRRSLVALVLLAVVGLHPHAAALDRNLHLDGRVDGKSSTDRNTVFVWEIRDRDPLTVVDSFVIDYGDGRGTTIRGTPPRVRCPEPLVSPAGISSSFKTFHRYEAAGTYEVTATVRATQRLCYEAIGTTETATVRFRVLVR